MITTEKEATEKWCPFIRLAVDGTWAFTNRWEGEPQTDNKLDVVCIASKCMAWRWATPIEIRAEGTLGLGYCGNAGTPQH